MVTANGEDRFRPLWVVLLPYRTGLNLGINILRNYFN